MGIMMIIVVVAVVVVVRRRILGMAWVRRNGVVHYATTT